MNFVERSIAALAPRYAAKRALARVQFEQVSRVAGTMRRLREDNPNFGVNTGEPNDARPSRLVDRATLLRLAYQNPYGRKAIRALLNGTIGWGITGAPKGPKALQNLWTEWTKVSDYRGRLNFYGQQALATRTMFREGDSFIVRRYVKDGKVIPLRIDVLDGGLLDTSKVGENIEEGIEYSVEGIVTGYWFYPARADYRHSRPSFRIPAEDVIHLYEQEEAGQKRGRSVFESVIKKLGDIDEALEADLVRRKIESCFVGFRRINPDWVDEPFGQIQSRGDDLPPAEYFEPGTMTTLAPGEDVQFADPKPAGGLNDALKANLLATAAGVGVTYEHQTGDLSNVNFSSYRAGALEFDATNEERQFNTIIPVFLDRVWDWFCQAAYEFGKTRTPSYEMRWTPPPRKSIDREGDAKADILEMQAGLENRRSLLNSRGLDHDTFMAETKADLTKQQGQGLFYKGDPFTANQAAGGETAPAQGKS